MIPRVLEPEAMETAEEVRQYDAMDHWGGQHSVRPGLPRRARAVPGRRGARCRHRHRTHPDRAGQSRQPGQGAGARPLGRHARRRQVETSPAPASRTASAVIWVTRSRCWTSSATLRSRASARTPSSTTSRTLSPCSTRWRGSLPTAAPCWSATWSGPPPTTRSLVWPTSTRPRKLPRRRALFEASLGAALTLEEIRAILRSLGHDAQGVSMTSDRHWTWIWRRP